MTLIWFGGNEFVWWDNRGGEKKGKEKKNLKMVLLCWMIRELILSQFWYNFSILFQHQELQIE